MFAFHLFIEDRYAALCDVERIAKVVGDDTRKLVETPPPFQFRTRFEGLGECPANVFAVVGVEQCNRLLQGDFGLVRAADGRFAPTRRRGYSPSRR